MNDGPVEIRTRNDFYLRSLRNIERMIINSRQTLECL